VPYCAFVSSDPRILVSCLFAVLGGCVPIPYPIPALGYTADSRHNLSDAVPAFIVQGQTLREEVLYKLGEPDQVLGAEQTFVYSSAYAGAGVGILIVAYTNNMPASTARRMLFRHLVVEFDTSGRVSSATSEIRACSIGSYTRDVWTQRSAPLTSDSSWRCPDHK